jgi:hypothetical protein
MAQLTFKPQVTRHIDHVEGKLKVLSSPDTYVQVESQKKKICVCII